MLHFRIFFRFAPFLVVQFFLSSCWLFCFVTAFYSLLFSSRFSIILQLYFIILFFCFLSRSFLVFLEQFYSFSLIITHLFISRSFSLFYLFLKTSSFSSSCLLKVVGLEDVKCLDFSSHCGDWWSCKMSVSSPIGAASTSGTNILVLRCP